LDRPCLPTVALVLRCVSGLCGVKWTLRAPSNMTTFDFKLHPCACPRFGNSDAVQSRRHIDFRTRLDSIISSPPTPIYHQYLRFALGYLRKLVLPRLASPHRLPSLSNFVDSSFVTAPAPNSRACRTNTYTPRASLLIRKGAAGVFIIPTHVPPCLCSTPPRLPSILPPSLHSRLRQPVVPFSLCTSEPEHRGFKFQHTT
jgi:hypothetical protein